MWADLSFDLVSFDPESWGPSWGLTWEAGQELATEYRGGGRTPRRPTETPEQREAAIRAHWDYMDSLRARQFDEKPRHQYLPGGPRVAPPPMRGTVSPSEADTRPTDVLRVAALAVAIAETIDD